MNTFPVSGLSRQLIIIAFLFICSAWQSSAPAALTADDAVIDSDIIKRLQTEEGPEISWNLHNAALENREDPYGLAREACQIMASNVQEDIKTFDLPDDEKEVLVRLSEELEQHQSKCQYRDWIRLSAKFCIITGFLRYKKSEPGEYSSKWNFTHEPDTGTSLTALENHPWEMINDDLAQNETSSIGEETSILNVICSHLLSLSQNKRYVFPSFQPLNLEYFIRTSTLIHRPAGVFLGGPMDADGYLMTRGMFFLHDITHADGFWDEYEEYEDKDMTLASMTLEHGIINHIYKRKPEINLLQPDLFKALELILFTIIHEDYAQPLLPLLQKTNPYKWTIMVRANEVYRKLHDDTFRDLKSDYGFFLAQEDLIHLAAIWLTGLSTQLINSPNITCSAFSTALAQNMESFSEKKMQYQQRRSNGEFKSFSSMISKKYRLIFFP